MAGRSGFTLVEMLMAAAIFAVGFASVYGMFLAGSQFRQRADSLTQNALAAASLIEIVRLRAATETLPGHPPSAYNGDGDPATDDDGEAFLPFPDQPRIWYRFAHAADLEGNSDGEAAEAAMGFRIILQVIDLGSVPGDDSLSVSDLRHRFRIVAADYRPALTLDEEAVFDALDEDEQTLFILRHRGLLLEQEAFVLRRGL